mgnify:CR=1 FL=1
MRIVANDNKRILHDREKATGTCGLDAANEAGNLTDVKIEDVGWLTKDCAYHLCKLCFPEGEES